MGATGLDDPRRCFVFTKLQICFKFAAVRKQLWTMGAKNTYRNIIIVNSVWCIDSNIGRVIMKCGKRATVHFLQVWKALWGLRSGWEMHAFIFADLICLTLADLGRPLWTLLGVTLRPCGWPWRCKAGERRWSRCHWDLAGPWAVEP